MSEINVSKSLIELGVEVPNATLDSSLIVRCKKAIGKPICQLSPDDLRLLITQSIGLDMLIPGALNILETDPLISSGLFKGDLLLGITSVPKSFWCKNVELNNRMVEIKLEVEEIFDTLKDEVLPSFKKHDFL